MPSLDAYTKELEKLIRELPEQAEQLARDDLAPDLTERVKAYTPDEKDRKDKLSDTVQSRVRKGSDTVEIEISVGSRSVPAVAAHERQDPFQPDPPPTDTRRGPKFLTRALQDGRQEYKRKVQTWLHGIFRPKKRKQPNLRNKGKTPS